MKMRHFFSFLLAGLAGIAAVFYFKSSKSNFNSLVKHHRYVLEEGKEKIGFDLLDPEDAPEDLRASVIRGYRIIMDTPQNAPGYAKDQLSCTNCHFDGGDTLGGKNNGISLIGVTTLYPSYSKRDGKTITLAERINNCFERSLSGKPLPIESAQMKDIINYLKWISSEVRNVKEIPWLGLPPLKTKHEPNFESGERLYTVYCAMCHKGNGEGGAVLTSQEGKMVPPIWGSNAFNDGAGMSMLPKLASFIYLNMPYQDARLTEEQAIDVAGFVLKQPRPHFEQKEEGR